MSSPAAANATDLIHVATGIDFLRAAACKASFFALAESKPDLLFLVFHAATLQGNASAIKWHFSY